LCLDLRVFQKEGRIEVTQVCDVACIEPDVGRRDVAVDDAVLVDLTDGSAKLAGPSEEFGKGRLPAVAHGAAAGAEFRRAAESF
jgi:hypothetical protein